MLEGLESHTDGRGEELRRGGVLRRCEGASEAIGFQSACKDLGIDLRIRVLTDSLACSGIRGRTGLGKVKRMAIQMLWSRVAVELRVAGGVTAADLMSMFLSRSKNDAHVQCLGLRFFSNLGQSLRGRKGVLGQDAFLSDLLHALACGGCLTPWLRRACAGLMTVQDNLRGRGQSLL